MVSEPAIVPTHQQHEKRNEHQHPRPSRGQSSAFGAPSFHAPYCPALAFSQTVSLADCYLCSFPNALISTSTPAGRSSFISASTVFCVGSKMSIRRLCVRISNASRDFLSTWGERNTQYLFFTVGNGIGPAICAPVRLAVSTISPVDWSRMR